MSLDIENYRCYLSLNLDINSEFSVIVGPNDSGKSTLLRALELFFAKNKNPSQDDINEVGRENGIDRIAIGVGFEIDPDTAIEIEQGVPTSLGEENLVIKRPSPGDGAIHELKVWKIFYPGTRKSPEIKLGVSDYSHKDFSNLVSKKESELNDLLRKYGIPYKKSGRSITNKEKRRALRRKAEELGIPKIEMIMTPSSDVKNAVMQLLNPISFIFFPAEQHIDKMEAPLQNELTPVISESIQKVGSELKSEFESAVKSRIEESIEQINKMLDELREAFGYSFKLTHQLNFRWEKSVSLEIRVKDHQVSVPPNLRGAGTRRLILATVFRWLAERSSDRGPDGDSYHYRYIFAIEEPEAFLHPKAVSSLLDSLEELTGKGVQVFCTTHSDRVVARVDDKSIIFVHRSPEGDVQVDAFPNVDVVEVARELGVSPRSDLLAPKVVVFVEGKHDVSVFSSLLRKARELNWTNLSERDVLLLPSGGVGNIQTLIEIDALRQAGRNFFVIVDKSRNVSKLRGEVERGGGKMIVLEKEDITEYIHPMGLLRRSSGSGSSNGSRYFKIRLCGQTDCDEDEMLEKWRQLPPRNKKGIIKDILGSDYGDKLGELIEEMTRQELEEMWTTEDGTNELIVLLEKLEEVTTA